MKLSFNSSFTDNPMIVDGCSVWLGVAILGLLVPQALVILFVLWLVGILRFE
jgi:hypothetical protein